MTTPSSRLAVDYPMVAPYVNSGECPQHGEATAFPVRYRGAVIAVLGPEAPLMAAGTAVRAVLASRATPEVRQLATGGAGDGIRRIASGDPSPDSRL